MKEVQYNYSFDNVQRANPFEPYQEETFVLKGGVSKTASNAVSVDQITMSLDYHFTLTIDGLTEVNEGMGIKDTSYNAFLPVESINLTPISIAHTTLNIGIFSDLPILNKRKMGNLEVTLLDMTDNRYEHAVFNWFNSCFISGSGCVKPLGSIIKEARYIEYDHTGKISKRYSFYVIPEGNVNISRGYGDSKLKRITFNTVIVGDVKII